MRFKRIMAGVIVCSMLCGSITTYNCYKVSANDKSESIIGSSEELQKKW